MHAIVKSMVKEGENLNILKNYTFVRRSRKLRARALMVNLSELFTILMGHYFNTFNTHTQTNIFITHIYTLPSLNRILQ